jgi:hypothetical protein
MGKQRLGAAQPQLIRRGLDIRQTRVAALATTARWDSWLWWGALGAYLGVLGLLRPAGG